MRHSSLGPSCGSSLARRLLSAVVTTAVLCAASTAANAQTLRTRDTSELLVIPFVAATVGGHTNLVDLEQAAGRPKTTFGGSVVWLGDGLFGLDTRVEDANLVVIPVPFDATTSYRPGTAAGPAAVKRWSTGTRK